ncbi:hypothetical protein Caci_1293 [Catenulispora acidiphila DSM 44928]|uniref:Uncharacterized protein n=1 Tax=Catenulispora acidiphila (strain DSM 44928 / JCM 14897 / NBRC 102108 / NRRL B-24433 / ID139908) TaxID=479433 RepID=C7Q7D0_CATAD|nr:hypothetical protein [Catenulispora acidiphila]ACU70218.1 hypothetical protein Caci_1293 [Catenulispora acidiphila DSM 44928]
MGESLAEESFFGMHSEAAVVTGIGLGPGLRRAARVCVGLMLVLGVVFWVVLALLYGYRVFFEGAHSNPDMPGLPDHRAWTAYYLVGGLWAVGVGVFGLAALARGSGARLLWCFGCLVTAFFWPLGMAASAVVVAARRPGVAVSRRIAVASIAVLVAVGGSMWRFAAPSGDGARAVSVGADGDLLGTWKSRSGMSVQLREDGTYAASALSGGGLGDGEPVPASSGLWDSESTDGHSGVRLLVDGDLATSLWFDVYRAGPDLLLCAGTDADKPCQVVLRRF